MVEYSEAKVKLSDRELKKLKPAFKKKAKKKTKKTEKTLRINLKMEMVCFINYC